MRIHLIELPTHPGDQRWMAYCRLGNEYNRELFGSPAWDTTPEESLTAAKADTENRIRRLLALDGDEPLGYARYYINHVDSPDEASPLVYVSRKHRGRGIGTALAERVGQLLAQEPIDRVVSWVHLPLPQGETLSPKSGHGAVPADHPAIRLLRRYRLELALVERVSHYDFQRPAVDPEQALADATRAAGDDYEALAWEEAVPDALARDVAALKQRMSIDPPAGELTVEETSWDAQRVRDTYARYCLTYRVWLAAVRHRPTGEIVALTELARSRSNPVACLEQWDTIVAPEHRGRRLGMLVKATNLLQVSRTVPDAPAIVTWNAEENRHMLAVNEALGFRPILVEGAFQRRL